MVSGTRPASLVGAGILVRPGDAHRQQASFATSPMAPNVESMAGDGEWPLLAGAMTQELHAALALISGYSQSLLHLPLDDETRRRYLERILSATDALSEFADRVLEVGGPGGGRPVLRRQPVAVDWMVDRLVRQLASEQDLGIVHRRLPSDLPLVDVDPAWITHVLRNLVRNAVTHGRGRPETVDDAVTIAARDAGSEVVVTVSDGGAGFAQDERQLAFRAMRGGRERRAADRAGLGFGLYLCRELVEAHGVRIWIEESSSGAAVSFTLPTYHLGMPRRDEAAQRDQGVEG